jgi:hypothetical protein
VITTSRRITDKALRYLLRTGHTPQQVAEATGAPLRRVVRLQSGGRSSYDPAYPPHRQPYQQLCSMDDKLSGTYGAYWRQFEGIDALPPAKPKLHRTVHMVPDDRADEQIDFTLLSGAKGRMNRRMILVHMFNHNTYHRGFVVETFCQVPAALPLIDLPIFMRGAGGMRFLPPHLVVAE